MNKKGNEILVCIILGILALYFYAEYYLKVEYGFLPTIMCGGALLLLYYTKKKVWALILGIIIVLCGVGAYLPGAIATQTTKLAMAIILILFGIVLLRRKNITSTYCQISTGWFSLCGGIFVIVEGIGIFKSYIWCAFALLFVFAAIMSIVGMKRKKNKDLEK